MKLTVLLPKLPFSPGYNEVHQSPEEVSKRLRTFSPPGGKKMRLVLKYDVRIEKYTRCQHRPQRKSASLPPPVRNEAFSSSTLGLVPEEAYGES